LIVKTGIANANNSQLGGLKGNRNAIAEVIENNVRRKIIREHLNDPAFYESMSTLLDEIIAARKARAIEYEEYLKRIGEVASKVETGRSDETPDQLNTPGKRALYNNLKQTSKKVAEEAAEYLTGADPELALTLAIDTAVKQARPDGWRGVRAREQVVKGALYSILKDQDEVERIFKIIFQQREY
jgi:type I restriction enzyme R subunit